ncbi:MAG TPA: class II aldolase/adducin family protein [Spirochaetales bacterium]|nr:class II aldolase/adducin family protein [Spirochaetales bacterium]HRZ63487.1 class II aldolase/adducin family protein [Spirochaetia bacterium]
MSKLESLVALSRRYGSDPAWVLAGGGNTSFKDGAVLYVKASGFALGAISAEGFCAVDRGRLDAIWSKAYPAATEEREAAVLADLMAARLPGEAKRPSVETLMHGLFPQAYVLHTHPALVNGLACGARGREAFGALLADIAIWAPFVEPGYVLAGVVRAAAEEFRAARGAWPAVMVMQNHGLLVAADRPEELDRLSREVVERLRARVSREPRLEAAAVDPAALAAASAALGALAPGTAQAFRADAETLGRAASREAFAPLASAFSPDHIVYAGHEFLYAQAPGALAGAWADYVARNASSPKVAVVSGLGAFGLGSSRAAAETALSLFADACKIAAYAEGFGGFSHMSAEKIAFIRGWEVEKYRSRVSGGGS